LSYKLQEISAKLFRPFVFLVTRNS